MREIGSKLLFERRHSIDRRILLDTPVSREIYGDAAIRVPLEPAAIADAIVRVMDDDALRETILEAGRDRLRRFSGGRTAAEIRHALEAAVLPS